MIFKEREQYKRRKKKKNRKKKNVFVSLQIEKNHPKNHPKQNKKNKKTKLFFSSLTESAGKKLDADCCASSIGLLFFTESDNRRCFVFDSFLF